MHPAGTSRSSRSTARCPPKRLVTACSRIARGSAMSTRYAHIFRGERGMRSQKKGRKFLARASSNLRFQGLGTLLGGEVWMAIYRTLYYGDVVVGVGGRITVPLEMREDLGIDEGDTLTVRVEETASGARQMVL